jgi:hypothetical protein
MNNAEEMQTRFPELPPKRCASCGEPLPFDAVRVNAWREGNQFFCNEFCAASIQDGDNSIGQRTTPTGP